MHENPYKSAETETPPVPQPKSRVGLIILSLIAVVLIVLFGSPLIRSARPAAERSHCLNNTKQIMLALLHYEKEHGSLPPAYTVDEQGNPLHSWRTLILPYMEHQTIYDQIDLTKPWDDPANAKAREMAVASYRCSSASLDDETLTTYLAVAGPETAFPGPNARTFEDFEEEPRNTIAIIDAPHEKAVHWMSPHDITIDEILNIDEETDTQHHRIFVAGYLDGHSDAIYVQIDRDVLRSLLTVADDMPEQLKPTE